MSMFHRSAFEHSDSKPPIAVGPLVAQGTCEKIERICVPWTFACEDCD